VGYHHLMMVVIRCNLLLCFLLLGSHSHADEILFREDFQRGLAARWKKVEFSSETRHSIRIEGTNSFLEARASGSASGLAVKLDAIPAERVTLHWRWRIDHIPPGGSDSEIKKFDHTARLFVAFRTLIGPPRTINYVWANDTPEGRTFHHPNSGRARFIALQSGNSKARQWVIEQRDLAADWKLLFGDAKPPAIVGLGFMTDSDGTQSTVTGDYDDIELRSQK
jgi:hypothetical protein